jgi:hypothetical protein
MINMLANLSGVTVFNSTGGGWSLQMVGIVFLPGALLTLHFQHSANLTLTLLRADGLVAKGSNVGGGSVAISLQAACTSCVSNATILASNMHVANNTAGTSGCIFSRKHEA